MTAPAINPLVLLFAAVFTGNVLLTNFLGMCSFISISSSLKSSNGLGIAVALVMTITSVLNWLVDRYILIPLGLDYLSLIVFIIVIAAMVQILEMAIERFSPALYLALGVFLPLITVNCAILGVVLFIHIRNYDLWQATLYGFGSGVGWWLAILALAAIRIKVDKSPVPRGLKGPGITIITIGLMAMAFVGFSGMLAVQ